MGDQTVNDTRPTLSNPRRWTSWLAAQSRRTILSLIVGAIIVVGGGAWAIVTYWHGAGRPELLVFRLCVGKDKARCPNDTGFVRNEGDDTLTKWAQRQCSGYKARRIIMSDGPKDCDCSIADVTCSTEY